MVPHAPPGLSDLFTSLSVDGGYHLTPDEFEPLRPLLGEASARHVQLRRTLVGEGQRFTLTGTVGIHDDTRRRNPQEAADPALTGLDLHYWFRLRRGTAESEAEGEIAAGWEQVVRAVGGVLGTHSADVLLYERRPVSTFVPAVALPIMVKESEVPGFTEIRGVRLVKLAADAETGELYSVIIDRFGERYYATVRTSLELSLDERILLAAHERARSVAELAFHQVTEQ